MPRPEDDFTSTVDGAAAFERWHAEPHPDDERPTLAEAMGYEIDWDHVVDEDDEP